MKKARLYLASLEDQDEDLSVIDQDDTNAHGVSDDVGLVEVIQEESQVGEELSEAEDIQDEAGDLIDGADQLALAGEELEEIQETLEAMKEDMASAPEYAKLALLSRTQCLYERLGVNLKLASNENFHGDRFQDGVFVESLEASLAETAGRIGKAIMGSISKAASLFTKAWEYITSTRARIYQRSKALQNKLSKMSEEDFKAAADKAGSILNKVDKSARRAAIGKDNKLVFGKDYAKQLQTLMDKTSAMVSTDKKHTEAFVKGLQDIKNEVDEESVSTKQSEKIISKGLEPLVTSYFVSTVRGGKMPTENEIKRIFQGEKLPIGDAPMAPGGIGPVATDQGGEFVVWPAYKTGVNEASFKEWMGDKKAVVATAEFVTRASSDTGIASKETYRSVTEWYRKMEKLVKRKGSEFADDTTSSMQVMTSVLLLIFVFPVGMATWLLPTVTWRAVMTAVLKTGFSISLSSIQSWIKALAGINTVLAAVTK